MFMTFKKHRKVKKLIVEASDQAERLRPTILRLSTIHPAARREDEVSAGASQLSNANIHPAGHEESSASVPQPGASDPHLTGQDDNSADAGTANAQAQNWPSGIDWEGIRDSIKACHDALLFVWKCKCPQDCHSVNVLLHHRFSSVPGDDDDSKV